jgi:tetrahydromethanopterin S-methyltransferase subunit A
MKRIYKMCEDYGFSGQETDRQDMVDSAIEEMLENVSPIGYVQWDMEIIGEIRDVIQDYIVNKKGWMSEQAFYPYRELDNNGNIILEPSKPEPAEMILTDEQIVTAMKQVIEDIDADELGVLAGDWLGGLCWYTNDGLYSFIPDEHYCGALDFTKELNGN